MQVEVAKNTSGANTLQLMSFPCYVQFHYQKKKYGRWIVRLFSKSRSHSFFSKYKFHFTCIIARHLFLKKEENHRKNSSWRMSDSRALLNSHLTAWNSGRIAIWLRKKLDLSLAQYTCATFHSRVKHAEWRRKRLLKKRSTLGIHAHDGVDRQRKVK